MSNIEIRVAVVGQNEESQKDLDAVNTFVSNVVMRAIANETTDVTAVSPLSGEPIYQGGFDASAAKLIDGVVVTSPRQMYESLIKALDTIHAERQAQGGEIYMEENQVIYHEE